MRGRISGKRVGGLLGVTLGAAATMAAAVAHFGYRGLLYPAPQVDDAPLPPGARFLALHAADGAPVHAIAVTAANARRTVVYFHGNGEVVGDDLWMAERLAAAGLSTVLVEYRGYGRSRNAGRPSEAGLYADATAVLDDLAARGVGAERIVLWGVSLGTGVATEMARRGRGAALVLMAPYTSIPDMAARMVPVLPVRPFVGDKFDNLGKGPALRLPTVVVHGADDEVVPAAMGARVAEAIPGARLERIARAHHMDPFLVDEGLLARVLAHVGGP